MPTIEYIYSAHSAFAYLGSKHLYDLCRRYGVTLIHRPILLSSVVEAQGSLPFRARTQTHVDYFFGREIERWAEYRGVDVLAHRPTYHDADYALASGMIIAMGETGAASDQMAHHLLEAHWRDDLDLSDPTALRDVAVATGHDPDLLLTEAASEPVQDKLHQFSDDARSRNVFGSPTYVVDGDPFYGQDHLDLVERALTHSFKAPRFRNPSVDVQTP